MSPKDQKHFCIIVMWFQFKVSKIVATTLNDLLSPLKTPNSTLFQTPRNYIPTSNKPYFKPPKYLILVTTFKLKKPYFKCKKTLKWCGNTKRNLTWILTIFKVRFESTNLHSTKKTKNFNTTIQIKHNPFSKFRKLK
jgi:hypothetical protein